MFVLVLMVDGLKTTMPVLCNPYTRLLGLIGCWRRHWLGESVACIKPIPIHEKLFAVGKSGPNATFATFNLSFLWVGVCRFHTNFFVFNPTEFGRLQTP